MELALRAKAWKADTTTIAIKTSPPGFAIIKVSVLRDLIIKAK